MDIIRYDLTTTEGYCEFTKYGFEYIPAILYISKSGTVIEKTDSFQEKEQLKLKLENLLKQP